MEYSFFMRSDMAEQNEPASFPEDGLWRRLLTRAQQGTSNHGFFVVEVVEGCMHTSMFCKLSLPTLFMRHHCNSLNEKIILEGPDGHQWPTMLGLQLDSQPCLMHGWKEFAADYNLEIRDQVVFLLFEYSHFLVQVYDVNNKVKRRVLAASPAKQGHADSDLKVKSVSQATHHTELPSVHGFKPSKVENFIHILDSSDEEEEVVRAPLNQKKMDAIKTVEDVLESSEEEAAAKEEEVPARLHRKKMNPLKNVKEGGSRMTLRSAKKVDTEDHTLSKRTKSAQPSETKDQVKLEEVHVQSDDETVQSDDETGKIMDAILGKTRSPNAIISAPSSPEPVMVLKRSRRLQRKSGDYEGDDLGRAPTKVLRSGKLYKLSQNVPGAQALLYEEPAKKGAHIVNDEILTSCCSTQNSTMKHQRSFRQLHESTSKDTTPKVTVSNATPAASVEPQDVMELEGRSRLKTKDRGKKRTEKPGCSSEEEANKRPARAAEAPVKVHKLLYISKRRPITDEEKQETLEAAQAYAKKAANTHYVLQLTTTQVYCGFHLKLLPEFVDAMQLPLTRSKVTLNKKWEVEWLGPRRPGLHSAGWTKFVLEHFLEEGDVCVFQKCSATPKLMISVEIFPIVPLVEPPERGWRSHYIIADE